MDAVTSLQIPFFICFFLSLFGILLHSPISIYLFFAGKKRSTKTSQLIEKVTDGEQLPLQLIQLPVYNEEVALVKALLDSACAVRYPREKLLIQLLDDSDQESYCEPIREYVASLCRREPELRLQYLHRSERGGYKAGNLNFGLRCALADFGDGKAPDPEKLIVSIFDADFQIPEEYLLLLLHHWQDERVGAVQSRLTFLNRDGSLLHRAAAIYMDNLHDLDFAARSRSGNLSMFRGSAGSLRFAMIEACGWWQGDTQIEDVDLSFHGQSLGWRIEYSDTVHSASLLPVDYNGFKLQQRSWLKGLMEVMKKNFGRIYRSPCLRIGQKIMAIEFFLIFALQPLFMLTTHLCLIPTYLLWAKFADPGILDIMAIVTPALLAATHIPFFTFHMGDGVLSPVKEPLVARLTTTGFGFVLMVSLFVTLSYGAVEGLLGVKVHRDRTAKQGDSTGEKAVVPQSSRNLLKMINLVEWLLACYSIGLVYWAVANHHWEIALVYTTVAFIYPASALLSRRLLAGR